MNANLLADGPLWPLKGITKVRPDSTLVEVWVMESSAATLVLEWRTRSAGQGFLRFERRGGQISCCNQSRSKGFVRDVLLKALGNATAEQWPDLVQAHGGAESLIEAATPRTPW